MKKYISLFILFWLGFQTHAQINGNIQTKPSDWQLIQNGQYSDIQQITPPVQLIRK